MNNKDATLEEISKELIELSKSLDVEICTPLYDPYEEPDFEKLKNTYDSVHILNIADFTI